MPESYHADPAKGCGLMIVGGIALGVFVVAALIGAGVVR